VTSSQPSPANSLTLLDFNAMTGPDCRRLLHSCLDVDSWVDAVCDRRPYASIGELLARSAAVGSTISEKEILGALDRHPRIGGTLDDDSRESSWSRLEQSRVLSDSAADAAAELATANAEYEKHFGFIFVICAAGRSRPELLAELRERLHNDPEAELAVVRRELLAIAGGRIQTVVTA
jgi:2-oxo-4-hydroxy-4-carboxy-5-ureidoimidazoline decarboxylase